MCIPVKKKKGTDLFKKFSQFNLPIPGCKNNKIKK